MAKQVNVQDSFNIHPTGATNTVNMSTSSNKPSSNAMADYDSGDYAQYSVTKSKTGYTNYTFTLPDIPSGATIDSITGQVGVFVNNVAYVTNTFCQLYTNTTAKGTSYTFASTSTSNIVTMTETGTWTLSELANLRLRIGGTANSSSNSKYICVVGATLTITYTYQGMGYEINASSSIDGINIIPNTQDVITGGSGNVIITIQGTPEYQITDNGNDISSQLVSLPSGTASKKIIPSNYTNLTNGINVLVSGYDITKAYNDADDATTWCRMTFPVNITGSIDLLFDFSSIPLDATIISISANARLRYSSASTMSNTSCQLYVGSTAKGNSISFNSTVGTKYALSVGSGYTRSDLNNLVMRIGGTSSSSSSAKQILIYGADITVNYEVSGTRYSYTVSNITTDHIIIVSASNELYLKINGIWTRVSEIYYKENGSWVLKPISYLSDNNIDYLIPM